jgi:acyl-CoA synthetase (AMP-forming)/AMP-acid ligase II
MGGHGDWCRPAFLNWPGTPQTVTSALNIADRLTFSASIVPDQPAVVFPETTDRMGRTAWTQRSFRQLDNDVTALARGLIQLGVRPGDRMVLMVRPSIEFVALTFAVFRAGAVCVLIDPGMGRTRMLSCLDETDPDGFLAVAEVHLLRRLMPWRFRNARHNITTGGPLLRFGCITLSELVARGVTFQGELPKTRATDQAAVIFTSGSTGPPRGVVYEHGMFDKQVDLIRDRYRIESGETDLPGFPLFALFNLAMQVTTVIPDMDPAKPACVDPGKITGAMEDQQVSQAYGSPAMWNRVGRHCIDHELRLPRLNRVLSAGAPVPLHVLRRMTSLLRDDADLFTPYGATECLPVASIGGREVLEQTAAMSAAGAGTCVGTVFHGVEVRIIANTDGVIRSIEDAQTLPSGEIGEIIVRGPMVTREYFRRPEATERAKITDGDEFWHRMGDVGYLDDQQRLWFCGRQAHVVHTETGPMYSVCCEGVFDQHPQVYRSALVGIGRSEHQIPVLVVEPEEGAYPGTASAEEQLRRELLQIAETRELTKLIQKVLFHRSFPVDTRHNVKIRREELAVWAASKIQHADS